MKHLRGYLPAMFAATLLAGCSQPIGTITPNQYAGPANLMDTPLHDMIPVANVDGTATVGETIDPSAVPIFTPVDQLDRATTFVTAEITPLTLTKDQKHYKVNKEAEAKLTVAYARLGQSGTYATVGAYQFGFEAWPGTTNVASNNEVTPARLVNYALFRTSGSSPGFGAVMVSGTVQLKGMTAAAHIAKPSIIRLNGDYYKLTILVDASRLRPMSTNNATGAGNMGLPFPDETGAQPLLAAQSAQN